MLPIPSFFCEASSALPDLGNNCEARLASVDELLDEGVKRSPGGCVCIRGEIDDATLRLRPRTLPRAHLLAR